MDMEAGNIKDVLDQVYNHLEKKGLMKDKEEFLRKFYDREERGSTYLGNYLALPHIESMKLVKTGIVIVRLNNYLTWTNDKPVKILVFVLIRDLLEDQEEIEKIQKIIINLDDDAFLSSLEEGERHDIEKNIRRIV